MNDLLAKNIIKFRKRKNYTQDILAKKLGVSFQAVSKWERGETYPDIELLPDLAVALDTDINSLIGYVHNNRKISIYEDEYLQKDYYWGLQPSEMCYQILRDKPPVEPIKLLDVGCGEGKDAVFFARNGYLVTAFDIADAGVEKTKRLADRFAVDINVFKANILDFRLDAKYDVIYSSGAFHYITPELRHEIISNYKMNTSINGINVINAFVSKPFIAKAPEKENAYYWKSGELSSHYHDWLIKSCKETIFDCNSSGIPHKHCMDVIVTERKG